MQSQIIFGFDLCSDKIKPKSVTKIPAGKWSTIAVQREIEIEQILNFQVPAEGLELVILLNSQY